MKNDARMIQNDAKSLQIFEKPLKMFVFYIQREFDLSFYYRFLTLTLLKPYFLQ